MCDYKTLKKMPFGQVIRCNHCNHMQVAFCTTVASFTAEQYYEFIDTVDHLYRLHNLNPCRDKKIIHIPLSAHGVAMLCSVNELKVLLYLLVEGRKELEYETPFVFSKN